VSTTVGTFDVNGGNDSKGEGWEDETLHETNNGFIFPFFLAFLGDIRLYY
jgi:hypothetical protein